MSPTLLDGMKVAREIESQLKAKVVEDRFPRPPHLAVLLVGDNPASLTYIKRKREAAQRVGIESTFKHLPKGSAKEEALKVIEEWNQDNTIDGILVQLPLPQNERVNELFQQLSPQKDVDGLTPENMGKLLRADDSGFLPCTPAGILQLLKYYEIETSGKQVVVVGRSLIVGRPLSVLMSHEGWGGQATVTLCHSRTKNLKEICKTADILISATGRAHSIQMEQVKEGAIVIDVGITRLEEEGSKATLTGDVDFDTVSKRASAITPVPGGVGPMTIALLLSNTVRAWERRFTKFQEAS